MGNNTYSEIDRFVLITLAHNWHKYEIFKTIFQFLKVPFMGTKRLLKKNKKAMSKTGSHIT